MHRAVNPFNAYLFIGEGNGKEKGQRGKIAEYMERAFRKQAGLLVEGGKGWEFRAFASGEGGVFLLLR